MPIVGWEYDGSAPLLLQDKIPVFLIRIRMDPGFSADPDPDSREKKISIRIRRKNWIRNTARFKNLHSKQI